MAFIRDFLASTIEICLKINLMYKTFLTSQTVAPKINVPPRFRNTAFFDKGENAVIKIPFIGNPRPRILWQREGEMIESGSHYSVDTQSRHAILTIRDVNALDTGSYRLTAENELGSDSVIIKIQISGMTLD